MGEDESGDDDTNGGGTNRRASAFDPDARIEELRAPYDHLRTESKNLLSSGAGLLARESPFLVHHPRVDAQQFSSFPDYATKKSRRRKRHKLNRDIDGLLGDEIGDDDGDGTDDGDDSEHSLSPQNPDSADWDDKMLTVVRLRPALEDLIARFIYENESGRQEVLELTKRYVAGVGQLLLAQVLMSLKYLL